MEEIVTDQLRVHIFQIAGVGIILGQFIQLNTFRLASIFPVSWHDYWLLKGQLSQQLALLREATREKEQVFDTKDQYLAVDTVVSSREIYHRCRRCKSNYIARQRKNGPEISAPWKNWMLSASNLSAMFLFRSSYWRLTSDGQCPRRPSSTSLDQGFFE